MQPELTPQFWKQFSADDWNRSNGLPVAAFVRMRDHTGAGFVQLAELACKEAGADFDKFCTAAVEAVQKAVAEDKARKPSPALQAAQKPAQKAVQGPALKFMGDMKPREMEWLWHPFVPSGAFTIVQGDPGSGKTFLACWLAALVTTGGTTPDGQKVQKGSVIFQSTEDGIEEGVLPRLIAAGCDMGKVAYFDEAAGALHVQDIETIREAFDKMPDLRLFVIDPVQSYMGGKVDMNKANEVRTALNGLRTLCNERGVAVLFIGHMGKNSDQKALHRLLGSIDFVAQARSLITVGKSQINQGERLVIHTKVSNAELGQPFAYHIENRRAMFDGFRAGITEYDLTRRADPGAESRVDESCRFIYETLSSRPMTVQEMDKEAKSVDINPRALRRAREQMKLDGILSVRKVGTRGSWYWYMKGKPVFEVDQSLTYLVKLVNTSETPAAVRLSHDQAFGQHENQFGQHEMQKAHVDQDDQDDQDGQHDHNGQDDQHDHNGQDEISLGNWMERL